MNNKETTNIERIQPKLMSYLSEKYGQLYSVPKLLMETLSISKSSAYKKMNGEVVLSLEELELLHDKFKIPISSFLSNQSEFSFQLDSFDKKPEHPMEYLENMAKHLKEYSAFANVEFTYIANEVPIFHLFNFPDLLKIKLYIWDYTNWNTPYLSDNFHLGLYEDEKFKFDTLRKSVIESYLSMQGLELWNHRFVDSLIEQIKYLIESYILTSAEDIKKLCESLQGLYDHLLLTAKEGVKTSNESSLSDGSNITIYNNQLIMTPLIIWGRSPEFNAMFTMLDIPNYVFCNEPKVNKMVGDWIEKLLSHSKLISKQGSKDRKQFFKILEQKIRNGIEEIETTAKLFVTK